MSDFEEAQSSDSNLITMQAIKLLLLLSNLLLLAASTLGQRGPQAPACRMGDLRRSRGICVPLRQCPAAISNLRSNVRPTMCNTNLHRRSSGGAIVCCPTEPRISEIMCDEYKEVLRRQTRIRSNLPPLPFDFIPEEEGDTPGEQPLECFEWKNPLVLGGRDAKSDEFPHMAGLGWGSNPDKLEWKCGGTLISDQFILTAAHCVDGDRPSHVLLGDIRKDVLPGNEAATRSRRVVVKIEEFIIHPGYRGPSTYNDIALVKLVDKVSLSKSIFPACLPQPHSRLELIASNLTTLGWGLVGNGRGTADVLQAVNLDRFSHDECNAFYKENLDAPFRYKSGILRAQFCAGDRGHGNKDSCQGDSGGPITVHDPSAKCLSYILGVTSFGPTVCGITPGVYTNVQSHLNWIEQIVWN